MEGARRTTVEEMAEPRADNGPHVRAHFIVEDTKQADSRTFRERRTGGLAKLKQFETSEDEATNGIVRITPLEKWRTKSTYHADSIWELFRGLYMRRRLHTPLVLPVHLTDHSDVRRLEEIFCWYFRKSNEPKSPPWSKEARAD